MNRGKGEWKHLVDYFRGAQSLLFSTNLSSGQGRRHRITLLSSNWDKPTTNLHDIV
jgi:hypothetical protein